MSRFRIVSWNIRAGGGRRVEGILQQIKHWQPDLIGLCEFRATPPSLWLAEQLGSLGYGFQISSGVKQNPAKNALLLASRIPLRRMNLPGMPSLKERWILARTQTPPKIAIGLMHTPNFTTPELKYPMLEAVNYIAGKWRSGAGLIMGDTNCTEKGIDEENALSGNFQREYDFMRNLRDHNWIDSFRHLYGMKREYTWYSHRNNGFRLDQAFCNDKLMPALSGFSHQWGVDSSNPSRRDALSDHAAMIIELDLSLL